MVLVKCFECEAEISDTAGKCPYCATEDTVAVRELVEKNKKLNKQLVYMFFLFILIMGVFAAVLAFG